MSILFTRWFKLTIFIVTVMSFAAVFYGTSPKLATPVLLDAVQYSNLQDTSAELLATYRITTPQDGASLVHQVAQILGCVEDMNYIAGRDQKLTARHLDGRQLQIRLYPVHNLSGFPYEMQIYIKEAHLGILTELEQQLRTLENRLEAKRGSHILVNISGTLPAHQFGPSRQLYIEKIFAHLKGDIIEGHSDSSLESWSGYSTNLPEGLKIGRNVLNLQIATRDLSHQNIVSVKIGSPLIAGTY